MSIVSRKGVSILGSIKVSEKHGVNPSMDVCFWCGEEKGIVLFGKLKGDKEAPRQVCTNYEPCDICRERMESGITLIVASKIPNGNPEIQQGLYPNGQWFVVTENFITNNLAPEIASEVLSKRKCFIDLEMGRQLANLTD